MKKILAVLLVLLLCSAFIYAETADESGSEKDDFLKDYNNLDAYTDIGKRFKPVNAEALGMGGAGVALTRAGSALFYNPSSLAAGSFRLSVPSLSVTLYHTAALLEKDGDGRCLLEKIGGGEKLGNLITPVLDAIGAGFSPFLKADSSVSLVLPFGLGIGVYASDTVYTYSGTLIDEIDASAALGYAYKIKLGSVNISAGAAARLNMLAFNQRLDAFDIAAAKDNTEMKNMDLVVASGWAPLFDFGITTEWKGLSIAVVLREVNLTGYRMQIDSTTLGTVTGTVFSFNKDNDLTIKGTPDLTFGLGYDLDLNFISLKAAVDFSDCIPFMTRDIELNARTVLKHLNAGLELGLFDTLILRGGIKSGYYTAGMTLDLYSLRIDAAYYWLEMGSGAGKRGVDGLTIRFNLGYDR